MSHGSHVVPVLAVAVLAASLLWAAEAPVIQPTPKAGEWKQDHERFVALAAKGGIDVLFLGDSITARWANAGRDVWQKNYAPLKAANFGIGGDKVENLLWRVQNGELEGVKPKVVVLLAGVNNSWGCPRDQQETRGQYIAEGLTQIVKTIRAKCPDAKVLVLAMFPLDDGRAPCVKLANETIAKLDDGKTVRYLDIGPQLTDASGNARKEYLADNVHLSAKGYEVWASAMAPMLGELLGQPASRPTTATAPTSRP
jgi:lysophospholipase L1-like esterase